MSRSNQIYAALLAVTLAGSWMAYKGATPTAEDKVEIFAPPRAVGLTRVEWSRGDESVSVDVTRGDEEVVHTWLETRLRDAPPKPQDPHAQDAPEPPADGPVVAKAFPGNERAAELVAGFQPLLGLRRLDAPSETAREEMGFPASTERLTLIAGDRRLTLTVGETAYGSDNVYVADEQGVAYLISSGPLRSLRKAEQSLLDRAVLSADLKAVGAMRVERGGAAVILQQHGAHDRANAWFARPDAPEERVTAADAVLEQLGALRLKTWPAQGEAPPDDAVTVMTAVVLTGAEGPDPAALPPAAALVAAPVPGVQGVILLGASNADGGEPQWLIRTDRTRAWVPVEAAPAGELSIAVEDLFKG